MSTLFSNLFKKSKPNLSIGSILKVDMHSHLLPGIDDGSPDMETSMALIRSLYELGFQKLITTPHIMHELYPNNREIIDAKLSNLRQALIQNNIDVVIEAAAEYYVDETFERKLETEDLLTFGENLVLIEQSMMQEYPRFREVIFDMKIKNYTPVIAHGERYTFLNRRREEFQWYKDSGCYIQVNLLSLQGYYGKTERLLAEYLVTEGLVDFYATDCHHFRHIERLKKFDQESNIKLSKVQLLNPALC